MPTTPVIPSIDLYAINTYLADKAVLQAVVSGLQQLGYLTTMEVSAMLGLTRLAAAPYLALTEDLPRALGCDTFGHRFLAYLDLQAKCTSHSPSGGDFTVEYVLLNVLSQDLGVSGLYDYFLGCCQCAKHYHPEEARDLWEQYLMGLRQHHAFPLSNLAPVLRSTPITRDDMLRHLRAFVTGVTTWPP